jgi:hypothetical protein
MSYGLLLKKYGYYREWYKSLSATERLSSTGKLVLSCMKRYYKMLYEFEREMAKCQ